jgi:RNA polymerase sigma-70 factor, ECF subfamily
MAALEHESFFAGERPRLWGIAYRVCGTRVDADDVVQDAWLRWDSQQRGVEGAEKLPIERPGAWLTTVTARLAIDRLRQRQRVADRYVGPWLPEFVTTPAMKTITEPSVPDHAELVDSLTVSFLVLLERLDPVERVVFLLAEVFREPYADIANVVGKSEAACRQIAHRAAERVRDPNRHRPVDEADKWKLATAFGMATFAGDLSGIAALLTTDSVLLSDGGAHRRAARRPVLGPQRIARLVANLMKRNDGWGVEFRLINGDPGAVVWREGEAEFAMVADVCMSEAGNLQAQSIFILRSAEKLASIQQDGRDPNAVFLDAQAVAALQQSLRTSDQPPT